MNHKDHYKTLGVDKKTKQGDIKKAYRRLARKYHPDVSKEANAEEMFKQINKAYDILGDAGKKRIYDQETATPKYQHNNQQQSSHSSNWQPNNFDAGFFEDIIRRDKGKSGSSQSQSGDFFNGFDNIFHKPNQRQRNNEPSVATIPLTLEDSYHGSTRKIRLPDGRNIQVKIPKGITEGQKIRISNGPGRNEMHLKVKLAPHALFTVQDKNIHIQLPITPWEAALGSMITVPTLSGKVKIRIPEGTGTGKKMRLTGRGLPGNPAGDQLLELIIVTPPATTKQQRELYRKMEEEFAWDPRKNM
jgi:curved DNA-binding protein